MLSQIEEFVNWLRRRSPNAHTWQDYRCDLKFFRQSVGECPPDQVTYLEIDCFMDEQYEKGFSPATINRRLASIAAFYTFLAPEDNELTCPVFPRRHHVHEPQRLPRPVREEDLERFFAVVEGERDLVMFILGANFQAGRAPIFYGNGFQAGEMYPYTPVYTSIEVLFVATS